MLFSLLDSVGRVCDEDGGQGAGCIVLTKNCIVWIHGHLILGRIANQTLRLRKGHIARSGPVALIVGNDLHFAMLKDPDTRVRGAKINANRW